MTDPTKTTVKAKGLLATGKTDLDKARDALEKARREYINTQTTAARVAFKKAQAKVFRLEDDYRDAYFLLLERQCDRQVRSHPHCNERSEVQV